MKTKTIAILAAVLLFPAGPLEAFSPEQRRAAMEGPWELVVKTGLEGEGLHFPIDIEDANKPAELKKVIPLMATPVKIRLLRYIPDLQWETVTREVPGGGFVAGLTITGEGRRQQVWLDSADPERQSVSASVGSIAIRRLYSPEGLERAVESLGDAGVAGMIAAWRAEGAEPFEFPAEPGRKVEVSGSPYTLTVMEYLPHYSIDTATKKVSNVSASPGNPAVRVRVSGGGIEGERWLWSKFPAGPHSAGEGPMRMEFIDFHPASETAGYVLFAAPGTAPRLLQLKEGHRKVEKASEGNLWPFSGGYSFRIDTMRYGAVVERRFSNASEKLNNPALVVSIGVGEKSNEAVLELSRPYHHKVGGGTVVLLYRPRKGS
jgi:hypothetical protein